MKKFNLKTKNIRKNFFKNFKENFFKDIKIKIISVILGISTFIIISFIQTSEKVFLSPLTVTGLKENFVISNSIPSNIKVTVKDKQNTLDKIVESDFKIRLDLSNIKTPGNYTIKFSWDIPKPMQSIYNSLLFTSIELNPDKVVLDIEKLIEKNIPIVLNSTGEVSKGYTIKKKTVDAYYVRIQGPEKVVNSIKYIETEPINIEGEMESFKRSVNLVSPSPLIKFIGITKVEVYFEIVKDLDFATYKFENIFIHNLNANFKAEISNKDFIVQVSGSKNEISRISNENIVLSIDCSNIYYPGEYSLRVNVSIPKNINLVFVRPEVVKVIIKTK